MTETEILREVESLLMLSPSITIHIAVEERGLLTCTGVQHPRKRACSGPSSAASWCTGTSPQHYAVQLGCPV
eukprot:65766-Rhodomonas_salina.1